MKAATRDSIGITVATIRTPTTAATANPSGGRWAMAAKSIMASARPMPYQNGLPAASDILLQAVSIKLEITFASVPGGPSARAAGISKDAAVSSTARLAAAAYKSDHP